MSTGDLALFQTSSQLVSADPGTSPSPTVTSPSYTTFSSIKGTGGLSTMSLSNDKLSQNSSQSASNSAKSKSVGDPTLPSVPELSFVSIGQEADKGSVRTILRSEVVVGSGLETVKFSQGLELGSKFNEKFIFPDPVKEKLNESSAIFLQNKEKDMFTVDKQGKNYDAPTSCYKGIFELL
jgi:hypothetical protein